jgi:S-formylglutathione hydrolase FrmB
MRVTAALLLIAAAMIWCGAARANQIVTITIPDRRGELPAKWYSYPGPPRARVLLPPGYDPRRAYRLVVFLNGAGNNYSTFTDPNALDAQKVLDGFKAIVVFPEGAEGWYADWYNNGAYGKPQWESYILDEVMPQIRHRYKILPQRRNHALFGISMGGLGATYLGGRLPGFFGSVATLSGYVDPQAGGPVGPLAQDVLTGAPPGSVVGPGTGFYATGHNPTALVRNLEYTRVFESAGDGTPTAADGTGGGVGNAQEAGVIRPMSDAYAAALKAAGIDFVYQTHTGCHCWPDFQDELRKAIAWGPFKPVVAHPPDWVNDTVAVHGRLWDVRYRFAQHPTAVVRFTRAGRRLRIGAAGSPVTLTTGRGCVLRVATPADVQIPARRCAPMPPRARMRARSPLRRRSRATALRRGRGRP